VTAFHAGVCAWNPDRTLDQFNVDGADSAPTCQYNYRHDNVRAFMLFRAVP
jgi:hypothetical protein